jgi:hypothetical protein
VGYMTVIGACFGCGRTFSFNATWVPSVPASVSGTGTKEPICADCVERANPLRIANGLEPIRVHPMAYEPSEV